jgi:DNA replication protein DnaC
VKSQEFLSTAPKITYECEVCKDEGGKFYFENGIEYFSECQCQIKAKTERLFKSSQITFEFRKKTFNNWDNAWLADEVRAAHKCSLDYASRFDSIRNTRNNSISLLGKSGAGKTHLLSAISNTLLNKNIQVFYFPFVEGFNELKSDFDALNNRIEKMKKVEVLFIDDLFKGRKENTQFQIEQMFGVVNYRYMNNLPILISSEKTVDELLKIDEALGSRIYEMSKNHTIELLGEGVNFRMRKLGDEE